MAHGGGGGGGPWTRSIEGVHGPGPDKGSMDRGSMFCTFPRNTKTKTKNNVQCFCSLHNLCY